MCDALERNQPREHLTELCHCTVHARRQFVDIRAHFPEECRTVVESMAPVYRVDAECRKEKLGPEERLRRHQAQSGPVMETLRQELQAAVDRKKIEPNSALGGAVAYLLDRWSTLTLFLKVPGAPVGITRPFQLCCPLFKAYSMASDPAQNTGSSAVDVDLVVDNPHAVFLHNFL